jgi:hypothetical protein
MFLSIHPETSTCSSHLGEPTKSRFTGGTMKKLLVVMMVLAVALCFAGCGGGAKDDKAATDKSGKAATAGPAVGAKATEDQVGCKFYPGADVFLNETKDENVGRITTVLMNTTDTLDKVIEFYKKELKLDPQKSPKCDNEWYIKVSDKVTLTVDASDQDTKRMVEIEYKVSK